MSTATFVEPTVERPAVEEAPSGPKRTTRRRVMAGNPGRIAAFVFDVDSLIDARSYESAMARASTRRLAARRGLDPMWLEVLAVQLANDPGAQNAVEVFHALAGDDARLAELPAEVLEALRPADGVVDVLDQVHRRFKLAVVSSRGRLETMRILRSLDLLDRFDAGAFVEPDAKESDANQICARALRLLDEPAELCVLVGQIGAPTLRAAGAAGMQAVGIQARKSSEAVVDADGPDLVVADMRLVEALAGGASSVYDEE